MDVYLSSVSHKLNPGDEGAHHNFNNFYPINIYCWSLWYEFSITNPETGESLPMNMPELYSPYGYIGVIAVMLLIVVVQLYIFHRKGWIRFENDREKSNNRFLY